MHWSVLERLTIWFFSLLSFTLISSVCCETQNKRTILMIIKILQTPISPYMWISLHSFNIILALTLRPLNICTDEVQNNMQWIFSNTQREPICCMHVRYILNILIRDIGFNSSYLFRFRFYCWGRHLPVIANVKLACLAWMLWLMAR